MTAKFLVVSSTLGDGVVSISLEMVGNPGRHYTITLASRVAMLLGLVAGDVVTVTREDVNSWGEGAKVRS